MHTHASAFMYVHNAHFITHLYPPFQPKLMVEEIQGVANKDGLFGDPTPTSSSLP
jgi:hypothetical protein